MQVDPVCIRHVIEGSEKHNPSKPSVLSTDRNMHHQWVSYIRGGLSHHFIACYVYPDRAETWDNYVLFP